MSDSNKVISDLPKIANLPEEVKIGDKTFMLKSPSIGVTALIMREVKKLLDLAELDIEKLDKNTTTFTDLYREIFLGIYRLIRDGISDEALDSVCKIVALLINNKPLNSKELEVTVEDIKWQMSAEELVKILWKILELGGLNDFFQLMILRMINEMDVEGIFSDSQKSSSQSSKQQAGQLTT